MSTYNFAKIKNNKTLEKLTLDLLEAEGFQVSSKPSQSGAGIDIIAEESIVSHSGFLHTLRWFVHCTHSNEMYLPVSKLKQILEDFDNRADDSLLIVADVEITEEGLLLLEEYVNRSGRGPHNSKNISKSEVNRKHLISLRQILESRFSDSELRTLCFDLEVDYDGLPGEGKNDKARELISYLERRDSINFLVPQLVKNVG